VIPVPQAVKDKILRTYPMDSAPTEDDFRKLYRRAAGFSEGIQDAAGPAAASDRQFAIPGWLKYKDGPFEHQGRAVNAWYQAEFRGILEMATGSGKTITSMICAHRLYEVHKPFLIVVAAPYVPLIEQWCDEL